MKKTISMLLVLVLALSFVACGGGGGTNEINLSEEEAFMQAAQTEQGTAVEVTSAKESYNPYTGENTLANDMVGQRPVVVSVNNIQGGWPQYGISLADVIVECETEGGITRLMCLFSDYRDIERVGSVRSLRDHFMEALYPVDPIIVHIGTSVLADAAILEHNMTTIDLNNFPEYVEFDWDRYNNQGYNWEYCSFTSASYIKAALEDARLNMGRTESMSTLESLFNFSKDGEVTPSEGTANSVKFDYSQSYDGIFNYNAATGTYDKFQFASNANPDGKAQMDAGNDTQLSFKNVFVLLTDLSHTNDNPPLTAIDFQAGGTGYYFTNGGYETFTWTKGDYSSNFVFTKADGSELVVNPGKSIISMIDKNFADTITIG